MLDALFWLIYAAVWLAWLPVAGLGRRQRRNNERRFAWSFSGLLYGPVLGIG